MCIKRDDIRHHTHIDELLQCQRAVQRLTLRALVLTGLSQNGITTLIRFAFPVAAEIIRFKS